jgi:hypothetical protein
LRDALAGADVEQLQRLTTVEAVRQLVGGDLRERRASHGGSVVVGVRKRNREPGFERSPVLRAVRLL